MGRGPSTRFPYQSTLPVTLCILKLVNLIFSKESLAKEGAGKDFCLRPWRAAVSHSRRFGPTGTYSASSVDFLSGKLRSDFKVAAWHLVNENILNWSSWINDEAIFIFNTCESFPFTEYTYTCRTTDIRLTVEQKHGFAPNEIHDDGAIDQRVLKQKWVYGALANSRNVPGCR